MKIILIVLMLFSFVLLFSQTVNGSLEDYGEYKILKVWGSHYQRGYAEGFLLADNIMNLSKNYFLSYLFQNNATSYESARAYFLQNFQIEPKYINEAQGLINGVRDSGANLYSSVLNRDLDYNDILFSSSITDISAVFSMNVQLGCCSLSSWGISTSYDSQLSGNLVITRHVDWSSNNVLLQNHLLVVHFPEEETETSWISFTYPGFLGALSAINQNGLASFMDMANNNSHPNPAPYYPTLLSARDAIEMQDYNSDGITDFNDFVDALGNHLPISGSLFQVVYSDSAIVVESNNQNGVVVRTIEDNSIPPIIYGTNLVLTNHFRKLYQPVYCYRYENFADSLSQNSFVDIQRSSNLTSACAGISANIQKIQYIPSISKVKWAVAQANLPAYQNDFNDFNITELFEGVSSQNNSYQTSQKDILIYPNPVSKGYFSVKFTEKIPAVYNLDLFNLKGDRVGRYSNSTTNQSGGKFYLNTKKLPSGLYFYKLIGENWTKSGKVMIIH